MHARFHRSGPRQGQIAELSPAEVETRIGRRLRWHAVLAAWWTFWSVAVDGVQAERLNDPLVTGGEVESFLVSPDSQRVVYRTDQDTNNVLELYTDSLQAKLKTMFESPLTNAVVAGIALIRG